MSARSHHTPAGTTPRPTVLRRILPTLALTCLAAGVLAMSTHATTTAAAPAPAGAVQALLAAAQAAASFCTAYEQRGVHGTSHRSVTYGLTAGLKAGA
ncbi:hypothetical protein [Streptomyces sp. NPDC017890]|uniref:hypothetical protein n=1 Tax=Streptomyces sp. NPDC017890 TaxID=3365015 RepID=UPI0037A6C2EB